MLAHLPDDDIGCQNIFEIAYGFARSQCLFVAVELDIFSLLAVRSSGLSEIGRHLQCDTRGLRTFLDALCCLGLLIQDNDLYSPTPVAARYLVKNSPNYIGDFFPFAAARLAPVWTRLAQGLLTGVPQNEAKDEPDYYANLGAHKARHEQFLRAMTALSARPAMLISRHFPWKRFSSFIDVGGASGSLAASILASHPHLRGTVFDLPEVFPFFSTANNCHGSLSFHSGDFFTDPLPNTDVAIMGNVLHNWNENEKLAILSKVFGSLNKDGAVIIYEWLLDDDHQRELALLDSLTMLLVTKTGVSSTESDCSALLSVAGFASNTVLINDSPYSIVVGWKL